VDDIVAANRREREASSPLPLFMVAFYKPRRNGLEGSKEVSRTT
jgi:hypothetical protein